MSRNVKPLTWQAILRWAPWMGGLLFFAWCVIFTWHGPGLQYDEALSVHGAVDLTAKAARSITCAGVVDVQVGRRCWPLMIAPYVGAVKDYVAAPLFRLFGIRVAAARMAAALFGALGIIGCAIFLRDRIGPLTGAAFALLMCAQPAYLDQVLFDNGNIAVTMGFIGIIAWTGSRFIQSARPAWAFVLERRAGSQFGGG